MRAKVDKTWIPIASPKTLQLVDKVMGLRNFSKRRKGGGGENTVGQTQLVTKKWPDKKESREADRIQGGKKEGGKKRVKGGVI